MKKLIKLFGLIALVAIIGFAMAACGDPPPGDPPPVTQPVTPITVSGTVTVPAGLDVDVVKINLFTNGWGWSKAFYVDYTGANTPWSVTMNKFSSSTTLSFQVEGYQGEDKFNPLFLFVVENLQITLKDRDVSGFSINLSNLEIIELSGTIDVIGGGEPIPLVFLFVQKLSNGALIGQTVLQNVSGTNTPWSIYALSHASNTDVQFGIQGFESEETLWSEDRLFEFGNVRLNDCKKVSNQDISGIKIILDLENGTAGDLPETFTDAERWYKFVDTSSTATLDYSVDGNGVCTITVGGKAEPHYDPTWYRWKTNARYSYTAKANVQYVYTFEAWTQSGERDISVQYYSDDASSTYLNTWLTITNERETYVVGGDTLPKGGVRQLEFQCADKLGTFYVKVLSIEEAVEQNTALLNGTWENDYEYQITFNNGTYEGTSGSFIDRKGTYTVIGTTSGGKVIMTTTHIANFGISGNDWDWYTEEDRWYSFDEMVEALEPYAGDEWYDGNYISWLDWFFGDFIGSYSINNNKLTLQDNRAWETYTYIKQ